MIRPKSNSDRLGMTRKKFLYNLSRSSFEKNWGGTYRRPGIRSRMLAGVFHLVPRVGAFKAPALQEADTGNGTIVHGEIQCVD